MNPLRRLTARRRAEHMAWYRSVIRMIRDLKEDNR